MSADRGNRDTGGRRVALVTGGSAGIGAATVRTLSRAGMAVAFSGRDAAAVDSLQTEVESGGGLAFGASVDMSDSARVDDFLTAVSDRLGPIDVLVNNVGQSPSRNFQRMSDEDWHLLLELNLVSAMHCTRGVLGGMRERGWGRIVMVSSLAAKLPDAQLIDYAASKAAMLASAKALARRYGKYGILVNSVLPGLIRTPMWERAAEEIAAAGEGDTSDVFARMSKEVPLGRYGTAEEVAAVIAFLVSDAASYVNGAAIDIDGGLNPHV